MSGGAVLIRTFEANEEIGGCNLTEYHYLEVEGINVFYREAGLIIRDLGKPHHLVEAHSVIHLTI